MNSSFQTGRTHLKDDPTAAANRFNLGKSGSHTKLVKVVNIDLRLTFPETVPVVGLSKRNVRDFFIRVLCMRKITARWVPKRILRFSEAPTPTSPQPPCCQHHQTGVRLQRFFSSRPQPCSGTP